MGQSASVHRQYKTIRMIGEGSFGQVWLVRKKDTNQYFVRKELPLEAGMTDLSTHSEYQYLRDLQHKRIVSLEEAYIYSNQIFLVMEFCEGGTLATACLAPHCRGRYSHPDIARWVVQIAEGLEYMHSTFRLIHRDIKPENVFVTARCASAAQGTQAPQEPPLHIKIGDFGISKRLANESNARTHAGTTSYVAPELSTLDPVYTTRVDVWATGCILFELLIRERLFHVCPWGLSIALIQQPAQVVSLLRERSDLLKGDPRWEDLCLRMLTVDAASRPTMGAVLRSSVLGDWYYGRRDVLEPLLDAVVELDRMTEIQCVECLHGICAALRFFTRSRLSQAAAHTAAQRRQPAPINAPMGVSPMGSHTCTRALAALHVLVGWLQQRTAIPPRPAARASGAPMPGFPSMETLRLRSGDWPSEVLWEEITCSAFAEMDPPVAALALSALLPPAQVPSPVTESPPPRDPTGVDTTLDGLDLDSGPRDPPPRMRRRTPSEELPVSTPLAVPLLLECLLCGCVLSVQGNAWGAVPCAHLPSSLVEPAATPAGPDPVPASASSMSVRSLARALRPSSGSITRASSLFGKLKSKILGKNAPHPPEQPPRAPRVPVESYAPLPCSLGRLFVRLFAPTPAPSIWLEYPVVYGSLLRVLLSPSDTPHTLPPTLARLDPRALVASVLWALGITIRDARARCPLPKALPPIPVALGEQSLSHSISADDFALTWAWIGDTIQALHAFQQIVGGDGFWIFGAAQLAQIALGTLHELLQLWRLMHHAAGDACPSAFAPPASPVALREFVPVLAMAANSGERTQSAAQLYDIVSLLALWTAAFPPAESEHATPVFSSARAPAPGAVRVPAWHAQFIPLLIHTLAEYGTSHAELVRASCAAVSAVALTWGRPDEESAPALAPTGAELDPQTAVDMVLSVLLQTLEHVALEGDRCVLCALLRALLTVLLRLRILTAAGPSPIFDRARLHIPLLAASLSGALDAHKMDADIVGAAALLLGFCADHAQSGFFLGQGAVRVVLQHLAAFHTAPFTPLGAAHPRKGSARSAAQRDVHPQVALRTPHPVPSPQPARVPASPLVCACICYALPRITQHLQPRPDCASAAPPRAVAPRASHAPTALENASLTGEAGRPFWDALLYQADWSAVDAMPSGEAPGIDIWEAMALAAYLRHNLPPTLLGAQMEALTVLDLPVPAMPTVPAAPSLGAMFDRSESCTQEALACVLYVAGKVAPLGIPASRMLQRAVRVAMLAQLDRAVEHGLTDLRTALFRALEPAVVNTPHAMLLYTDAVLRRVVRWFTTQPTAVSFGVFTSHIAAACEEEIPFILQRAGPAIVYRSLVARILKRALGPVVDKALAATASSLPQRVSSEARGSANPFDEEFTRAPSKARASSGNPFDDDGDGDDSEEMATAMPEGRTQSALLLSLEGATRDLLAGLTRLLPHFGEEPCDDPEGIDPQFRRLADAMFSSHHGHISNT